jgi:hypothetical protein
MRAISLLLSLFFTANASAQGIPDPRDNPASKLPGNLQNAPLPELAVAASTPRSFGILVNANNTLPAADVDIATSGGAAPVRFNVVGGAAAVLYQILEPTPASSTPTRVLSPAEQAAAELEARVNPRPAGSTIRRLRFLGVTQPGNFGAELPVQIRATDARGANVTFTVRGLPFAPRIAPVAQPRTALETWQFPIVFEGLGAMTQVRVDSVSGDCGFKVNTRVIVNPVLNVSNGRASTSRTGSFRTSGTACSSLRVTAAFKLPDSNVFGPPLTLGVPAFTFRAPQLYAFGNTKDLETFFGFTVHGQTGVCSGDSLGPSGSHPVGIIEKNDDLSFAIRSGPLGTECDFVSLLRQLPDGFALTKMDFSKSEGPNDSLTNVTMGEPKHYCKIGGSGGTVGGLVKFDFTRGTNNLSTVGLFDDGGPNLDEFVVKGFERPLVTADNVIVLEANNSAFATMFLPMFLKLRCVMTPAGNSEFITIRLNRVEFIGPPGLSFP